MANVLTDFENIERRRRETVLGVVRYIRVFDRIPKSDIATVRPALASAMPSTLGGDTAAVVGQVLEFEPPGDWMGLTVVYELTQAW